MTECYSSTRTPTTTVLVAGEGRRIVLFVNGKADASTNPDDLETQLLFAHAPLFLNTDARSVLVVGYGSGITLGSVLRHPVERVDVAEISRGVLRADSVFREYNYGALLDSRVRVYEEDGQSFLRTTPRQYDAIISQPSNPWMAGVSDLFTVDYFEAAQSKLEPAGVFVCWLHTYQESDANVQLILRTLASVFDSVMLFVDADVGNVIALASDAPLSPDFPGMEARFRDLGVRLDLERIGVTRLESLQLHQRIVESRIGELIGTGPLNTHAHQRLGTARPDRPLTRSGGGSNLPSSQPSWHSRIMTSGRTSENNFRKIGKSEGMTQ